MKGSLNQPKVFISYSWSNSKHEQWVLDLAKRLFSNGIHVILDQWDLREGQDKHAFMEQMVADSSIQKVLVICDAGYQSKANIRKGGVGTESQLISQEVYDNSYQEKFIPIVTEYDDNKKPCMPHFIANRIYIDLSSEDIFENGYERLVRTIFEKPERKRPTLGTPPSYITDDEPIRLRTTHKVNEVRNALIQNKHISNTLIHDYYDLFTSSLVDYTESSEDNIEIDEKLLASIEKMKPLRNDFIEFIFTIFRYQETVDLNSLKAFFEKLYSYQFPNKFNTQTSEYIFDYYKFISYELMLYLITILLKLHKYQEAAFFINADYFHKTSFEQDLKWSKIYIFNPNISSLNDYRNVRLSLRRASVTADLIKSRANSNDISFEDIIDTELILYYISTLHNHHWAWFPRTACYRDMWGSGSIDFFQKQVSLYFFEKVKVIYEVNSIEDLKAKVQHHSQDVNSKNRNGYNDRNYTLLSLERMINIEKIGTIK